MQTANLIANVLDIEQIKTTMWSEIFIGRPGIFVKVKLAEPKKTMLETKTTSSVFVVCKCAITSLSLSFHCLYSDLYSFESFLPSNPICIVPTALKSFCCCNIVDKDPGHYLIAPIRSVLDVLIFLPRYSSSLNCNITYGQGKSFSSSPFPLAECLNTHDISLWLWRALLRFFTCFWSLGFSWVS